MKKSIGLVFSLLVSTVPLAHAGVLGDSIGVEYQFSDYHYLRFLGRDVVGTSGVEYSYQNLNIVLHDQSIEFSFDGPMTFDSSEALLSFRNRTRDFDSSFAVAGSNLASPLGSDAVYTDEHFLQVDLTGRRFTAADHFVLAAAPLSPVPEPTSPAMLLTGLGLMGFLVRRGRRA